MFDKPVVDVDPKTSNMTVTNKITGVHTKIIITTGVVITLTHIYRHIPLTLNYHKVLKYC